MPTFYDGVEVERLGDDLDCNGHDIELGAGKLKMVNHLIKEQDPTYISIKNIGDTDYSNLYMDYAKVGTKIFVDIIDEITAATGVTVDGVKLKDTNLNLVSAGKLVWNNEIGLYRASATQIGVVDHPTTVNLDLSVNTITAGGNFQLGGIRECNVTDDVPGTPTEGDIKLDSVNHKLQFYNGTAWKTFTED